MSILALLLILSTPQPAPTPYVTIYHDDKTAFQMRRDRITPRKDGTYMVWLRWLWAEPRPWKTDHETARIVVADVDCAKLRVRELAILHKNREGKIFDEEEVPEEKWEWKTFAPESGAEDAVERVCQFIPQLLQMQKNP